MSRAVLPAGVRRWLRLPLWFGIATGLLAGGLIVGDVLNARSYRRDFADAYRLTAELEPGGDRTTGIDLSYVHPDTGDRVHTSTAVWQVDLPPADAGSAPIEVARHDPQAVVLAGDRFPATAHVGNYAPWALLPFAVWAVRRWTVWRSSQLTAEPGISFAMVATAAAPGPWGRRWRLQLFPLDVDPDLPDTRPVCTVPLVTRPTPKSPFRVEVKGAPRPYGRVVARAADDGAVLWPSGRAGRSNRRDDGHEPVDRRAMRRARALLLLGVAVAVPSCVWWDTSYTAFDVQERAETVETTVTGRTERAGGGFDLDVTYEWKGDRHTARLVDAPAATEGDEIVVHIDPEEPTLVWPTGQETPPGTSEADAQFAVLAIGFVIIGAGAVGLIRASTRTPGFLAATDAHRGLRVVHGRLWHGQPGDRHGDPCLRLEATAAVLVETDGRSLRLPWDHHAAAPHRSPEESWWLEGSGPPSRPLGEVWVVSVADRNETRRRLAASAWLVSSWSELPALAAYVAATPEARPGLGDPAKVTALVRRLGGWSDESGREQSDGTGRFDVLLPDR